MIAMSAPVWDGVEWILPTPLVIHPVWSSRVGAREHIAAYDHSGITVVTQHATKRAIERERETREKRERERNRERETQRKR